MMVELGVRLGLAIAVAVGGLLTGQKQGEFSVQIALVYSLISVAVFAIDWYKKRNSGVAGFIAVFDAMFIAAVLSSLGQLDRYGFMVLAPMMWATGRYSSDAAAMAPLVASTVMVSSNFFSGPGFTVPTMLHTLGILVVGLLTNQAKVVVKEREVQVEVTKEVQFESEESIRMKETYASLKSHISELEESSKRERLGMKLWAAANGKDEPPILALAGKLKEDTGIEGVAIYTLNSADRKFVIGAVSGKVPEKVRDSALTVGKGLSEAQMVDRLTRQVNELRDPDRAVKVQSLLIKDLGKPCGCLVLFDTTSVAVDTATRSTKPVMDYLGGLVSDALKKEDELRRLREAEVLYGVASVCLGAESKQNLITRVLREIGDVIQVDHLAGFVIDGNDSRAVTTIGATHRVMDHLSFAYGSGLTGWLATQSPEVIAPDALDDDRIDRAIALKHRIGSLAVIPILDGDEPLGFITASTHRVGGIDRARLETLRAVTAELTQALIRQEPGSEASMGAMTPSEFYGAVRKGGGGHFVYFDIVNREQLQKEFGKPAIDTAMRKITHRLRMRMPSGGGMCRRDEGDFVAYLVGQSDDAAQRWANDSSGILNGLNLTTPDGRHRLAFTIRAKVAPFTPQKPQVSEQEVA